jgi:double-GTPase-like protein
MENQLNKSILIFGKPSSSKTAFLAQLILLANKQNSKVSFWKKPNLNTHLKQAVERIREGKEPEPTHAESSFGVDLPIQLNGNKFELYCPDYGGEQVTNIVDFKEVSEHWQEMLQKSSHWILFIRLGAIDKNHDLTTKSPSENSQKTGSDRTEYKISDEVLFTELLQVLSFAKCARASDGSNSKIIIALTCYDEIETKAQTPLKVFTEALPLLSQYISSNWSSRDIKVIGVSALGLDLNIEENSKKYIEKGHDKFPFVVLQDNNERIYDLTHLIFETLTTE